MQRKIMLEEKDIPSHYYNILADLPNPLEPDLHPGTKTARRPAGSCAAFSYGIDQAGSRDGTLIPIPDPVRDAYSLYRPTPMYRAYELERALDTPAHIYYKYERSKSGRQP